MGKVFNTDPHAGSEVPEGITVQVYASGGPPVQDEPEPPAPERDTRSEAQTRSDGRGEVSRIHRGRCP